MRHALTPCCQCGAVIRRIITEEFGRLDWCSACDHPATAAPPPQGFGSLLRRLLAERAVTQTALAARLGINRVGIARLVTGRREATADMCEKIAVALGLNQAERRTLHGEAARARGYQL